MLDKMKCHYADCNCYEKNIRSIYYPTNRWPENFDEEALAAKRFLHYQSLTDRGLITHFGIHVNGKHLTWVQTYMK